MIKAKQKKQDFNKFIIVFLTLFINCSTVDSPLYGIWKIKTINIEVNEDMKYLQELNPGLLEDKFQRKFPKRLKGGDYLSFNKKNEIIVNQEEVFYYKLTDSLIYIRFTDIIYPLDYKIKGDRLILSRQLHQGKIEWELKKEK